MNVLHCAEDHLILSGHLIVHIMSTMVCLFVGVVEWDIVVAGLQGVLQCRRWITGHGDDLSSEVDHAVDLRVDHHEVDLAVKHHRGVIVQKQAVTVANVT